MCDLRFDTMLEPASEDLVSALVEQLDAAELALGQYLTRCFAATGPGRGRPRGGHAATPRWYRGRIAEWCRHPTVCSTYGVEAVLSTRLAVPHLTDQELLLFVDDLFERVGTAPLPVPAHGGGRRRIG
jgi:hypothetical protein